MSLRFIDSFSHYGTADLFNGFKWTTPAGPSASQFNVFILSGYGRFGSCCLRMVTNAACGLMKTFDSQATWIVGFAFRLTAIPNGTVHVLAFSDGGANQVTVCVNTDLTLSVTRANNFLTNSLTSTTKSASAITVNTWYYLEFICTIAASISLHTCKVNINGSNTGWLDISAGQNTKSTANATANQVYLGNPHAINSSNAAVALDFCDVYVCDVTGATNNAFLGDIRVEPRLPYGAGANTAWAANGATSVACVSDQNVNYDTSFISSSSTNDISTFTVPTLSVNPTAIFGMQVTHTSRKTDAGVRQIADVVRSGSTNYIGTTQNLGVGYQTYSSIWETDPNTTAAWTYSAANALEIGAKEIT